MNDLFKLLEKIEADGRLSWQECADLYRLFPLGRRLAEKIVDKALTGERTLYFGERAPEELKKRFLEVSRKCGQDEAVRQTLIFSRIYGTAVLYAVSEESPLDSTLNVLTARNEGLLFKAGDPLAVQVQFNQDPRSFRYLSPESAKIRGVKIDKTRCYVCFNGTPMYLQYSNSGFNYGGRSVYENQIPVIRVWAQTLRSMGRMGNRASGIFAFFRNLRKGGANVAAASHSLELVKSVDATGGVALGSEDKIEFPTTSGIGDLDTLMSRIEREIVTASDTPLSILLDERLANGFGNGSEDYKQLVQDLKSYRERYIRPLYTFSDIIVAAKAFTPEFLSEVIRDNPDIYQGYTVSHVYNDILEALSFDFGELYPQSGKEIAEEESIVLDVANKAVTAGVSAADIEAYLTQKDIFPGGVSVAPPAGATEYEWNEEEESPDEI